MSKMKWLTFVFVVLSFVCANVMAMGKLPDKQKSDKPNIIFFLIDDQRDDTLGCAGHPIIKTPVVDDLAANGVRFSNAFVTTSICAASRASILTGLHERTHGYTFGKPPVSRGDMLASYPAVMQKAGYRTGFIGKYGIKAEGNLEEDIFDYYVRLHAGKFFYKQPDGSMRHETELAADKAIEFMKENPKDKPFCLSISFNAVHAKDNDKENHFPWPKAVDGMYDDIDIPEPRLSDPEIYKNHPAFFKEESMHRVRYHWRWDTPEKYQKNMRAYFRMISGVDRAIGRVRAELEKLKLDDNTVIIYMADNGYYMGDRGFAGKWSHYEQSLRVPLIVFDPRLKKEHRGQVREDMALNIDIAPTLLSFAGIKIPAGYQGQDIVPLLAKDASVPGWRNDFFCEHLMDHKLIPKWEGVRGERYVYARYFGQEPVYEYLHDLETDPDQLVNLASNPKYKDILEQMRKRSAKLKSKYTR